jgi:transposase-like protein
MQQRAEGREDAGPLGELHRQLQQMREENEILKREIQEIRRSRN